MTRAEIEETVKQAVCEMYAKDRASIAPGVNFLLKPDQTKEAVHASLTVLFRNEAQIKVKHQGSTWMFNLTLPF
jgi:hypothetical protein